METVPPQPVGDAADLLIAVVLPGEPLGFRQIAGRDEPEPVHGQGREAGLAVVGAAEYVEIRRDPGKDLPFWQRLENPFRCSSRNSQTGVFVRIALPLCMYPVNSWIPIDFRSREEIQKCIEANKSFLG